jgi:SRSO17 transposase
MLVRSACGIQRLLSSAAWDADAVLGDVPDWVLSYLGDPDAIVVSDETGGVEKDACTVGVQRQYTGTAGRSENSQVAVYLTYAWTAGTPGWTGPCICLRPGPTTVNGWLRPACRMT